MFLCESKLPHVVSSDCKALHIPHHSTLYHLNASSAMPQVKSKLDFKRFQVMDDGSTWGAHGKHEAMPAPPTTALARLMSRQASHGSHGAQTCHVSYPVAVSPGCNSHYQCDATYGSSCVNTSEFMWQVVRLMFTIMSTWCSLWLLPAWTFLHP